MTDMRITGMATRAMVAATDRPTAALQDAWRDHVLHGSGAAWRSLFEQFFSISMVLALPLLAMALIKRLRVDHAARERLIRAEREEDARLAAAAAVAASEIGNGAHPQMAQRLSTDEVDQEPHPGDLYETDDEDRIGPPRAE